MQGSAALEESQGMYYFKKKLIQLFSGICRSQFQEQTLKYNYANNTK